MEEIVEDMIQMISKVKVMVDAEEFGGFGGYRGESSLAYSCSFGSVEQVMLEKTWVEGMDATMALADMVVIAMVVITIQVRAQVLALALAVVFFTTVG
ncbi:uncharacterized protein A4U43_C04F480 [Asparagus officinalis]|uniref:Uncharacterized protein n=1 Tax=Asparagus officinalis TaxID=4686 RepID=A0A5P1EZW4_ASPOF|nr:uncharacterized protein A4U43_C04F480 [Asparagus officinalis]